MVGLSRDRQHRSAIHLCIVKPVQEMNRSGSRCCQAYAELAAVFCTAASHERGSYFVTDLNKPNLLLMRAQGFHHSIDTVTRQAEDGIHAPLYQALNQCVGSCLRHFEAP